jgi:hypothetical protein
MIQLAAVESETAFARTRIGNILERVNNRRSLHALRRELTQQDTSN